jgi:uncharacterized protein with PIN domain
MQSMRFRDDARQAVEIDVCHQCNGIWFDPQESARLDDEAVVQLFDLVHQRGGTAARPTAADRHCPRCDQPLQPANIAIGQAQVRYWQCPSGHGRHATFLQLLFEKEFVRPLSGDEVARLPAMTRGVRCAECGGTVDPRGSGCANCSTPLMVLDRGRVHAVLQRYVAARRGSAAGSAVPAQNSVPLQAGDLALDPVATMSNMSGRRLQAAGLTTPAPGRNPKPAAALAVAGVAGATGAAMAAQASEQSQSRLLEGVRDAAGDLGEEVAETVMEAALDGAIDMVGSAIGALLESVFS